MNLSCTEMDIAFFIYELEDALVRTNKLTAAVPDGVRHITLAQLGNQSKKKEINFFLDMYNTFWVHA